MYVCIGYMSRFSTVCVHGYNYACMRHAMQVISLHSIQRIFRGSMYLVKIYKGHLQY